jgi:hypothetical protein
MKPQTPTASKRIDAPADMVYGIIADYRHGHQRILPKPYFLSLEVEEGGYGAGTIVNFEMSLLGRRQDFRSLITEPEPGRLLIETDIRSGILTSFLVAPAGNGKESQVIISTELRGVPFLQALVAKTVLQRVYRQELELLAKAAKEQTKLQQSPVDRNV